MTTADLVLQRLPFAVDLDVLGVLIAREEKRARRARLTVHRGDRQFAPSRPGAAPRMSGGSDLAGHLGQITDPRSREVLTASGTPRAVPMTGLVVEYSEAPYPLDHLPLRSAADALKLLAWLHEQRRKEPDLKADPDPSKPRWYWKTVIRATWSDGSSWRARFDIDGRQTAATMRHLFGGDESGGGVTWENTTDKNKIYQYDAVFPAIPEFNPSSLHQARTASLAQQAQQGAQERDKLLAKLPALKLGEIYFTEAHRDVSDGPVPAYFWRVSFDPQHGLLLARLSPGSDDPQESYLTAGSHDVERIADLLSAGAQPTGVQDFAKLPRPKPVRALAQEVLGDTGAGPENRVIKATLQAMLGDKYQIRTRSSSGTGYGWSHIGISPDDARAQEALREIGMRHGTGERYHAVVPARFMAKTLAILKGETTVSAPVRESMPKPPGEPVTLYGRRGAKPEPGPRLYVLADPATGSAMTYGSMAQAEKRKVKLRGSGWEIYGRHPYYIGIKFDAAPDFVTVLADGKPYEAGPLATRPASITLAAEPGTPGFGGRRIAAREMPVRSWAEAKAALAQFIKENSLNPADFADYTGDVSNIVKRKLGKITYDGRALDTQGNPIDDVVAEAAPASATQASTRRQPKAVLKQLAALMASYRWYEPPVIEDEGDGSYVLRARAASDIYLSVSWDPEDDRFALGLGGAGVAGYVTSMAYASADALFSELRLPAFRHGWPDYSPTGSWPPKAAPSPAPAPAPATGSRIVVRNIAPAPGSEWVNVQVTVDGKPLRYGFNTAENRWARRDVPPPEVMAALRAADTAGLLAGWGPSATSTPASSRTTVTRPPQAPAAPAASTPQVDKMALIGQAISGAIAQLDAARRQEQDE